MRLEKVLNWVRQATGALLAIGYALAVYGVIATMLIPDIYLIFIVPITFLMVAPLVYLNLKKSLPQKKSIAVVILSLILAIASFYVYGIARSTNTFINNLHGDEYVYEEYNIIAKKDRRISLKASHQQAMGLLKTDSNNNLVKDEINKRTNVEYQEFDNPTSLTVALSSNQTDLATLKSSYVQLLSENHPAFYESIEVIDTFKIKIRKDIIGKADIAKPFVVYISGIDTYGDIAATARSDVNILAVVNPQTHKILLVNTPRDYYVQLHGTTGVKDKLTHAGIYGIDMSIKTLQDLYETDINYYLRINFASLTKLVDALGGINVYSDNSFKSYTRSYNQGYNQLDGQAALEFSRERYAFEDGDRQRGKNQQRVIEAIIAKLSTPETLVNYQSILSSLDGSFQTNAKTEDITTLMNRQMNSMSKWQVESISVDGTGKTDVTYSMGSVALYVMEPNTNTVNSAKQKIKLYLK